MNFLLENVYHRDKTKHKVESRFLKETADLYVGLLGLIDTPVGVGGGYTRLYKAIGVIETEEP